MAIGPNVVDDCEGMTEEDYWRAMDEAMQDEEGDEPFCNCTTGHSIEEMDWNQCDSCGKPIYDEEPDVPPAPTSCRKDGRCQYAIDHGAEELGHCPPGKCVETPNA